MILQVRSPHKQQGAVLVIGLIMLLLLTIIGLASIRGSDLQERMAGNMRDRNLGFQAAEAGLRIAEHRLNTGAISNSFDGLTTGYYPDLNLDGAVKPRPTLWLDEEWRANSISVPNLTLKGLSEQPRYAIEKIIVPQSSESLGGAVDFPGALSYVEYYRVTARGLGGTTDTEVVLQSTVIP